MFKYTRIITITLLFTLLSSILVYAEPRSQYNFSHEQAAQEFDYNEYNKYLEPQKVSELTQEQIDDGWIIVDGYAYPPTSDSEICEQEFGADDIYETDLGNVTFTAHVDNGVSHNCYFYIQNLNTEKVYQLFCDAADNWVYTLDVPAGVYIITSGGVVDSNVDYMVNQSNFEVKTGEHIDVDFIITDTKTRLHNFQADASGNTIQHRENPQEIVMEEKQASSFLYNPLQTQEEETTTAQKGINIVLTVICVILAIGLVGFAVYKYWIYSHNGSPED